MPAQAPRFWAGRGPLAVALLPLSLIFLLLARLRRQAYARGWLRRERLPVPVVVVGNVAVGGSGKTPVVAWAVARLREAGHRPGVISRGYGGSLQGEALVDAAGPGSLFGDEPLLLARECACPVAVGRDRVAAARLLLQVHPECDVLVSDDGLQHYRLPRQVEIIVVDEAVLGNALALPAGPLRETLDRLRSADLLLWHGAVSASLRGRAGGVPAWPMRLHGEDIFPVAGAAPPRPLASLAGQRVHAIAGIGRPQRFFDTLRAAGLQVVEHPFPDHHPFCAADLDFAPGEVKIMTSKDAVKCAPFAGADCWVLPVQARIDPAAARHLEEKVQHGRPTA